MSQEQELAAIVQLCDALSISITKYLNSRVSKPQVEPGYEKTCKYGCNQRITLRKLNNEWRALNLDGTEHGCQRG